MGVQTIFWTIKCKLNIFMEILLQIAYFKFDDMDDESKQVLPKPPFHTVSDDHIRWSNT